jgi:hypothetical protein
MRALVVVHRWLGVAFCLLFAMWFASGIVMHFVPFPALTEAERFEGLAKIDLTLPRRDLPAAIAASRIPDATRARLIARDDGIVYIFKGPSGIRALMAADLSPATVQSASMALKLATGHARRRGMTTHAASVEELADYDQWTVSNGLDPHRPIYRVALNDEPATELYVSSTTGEVVRDTTRRERWWNYAGSVVHWIYPTVLRRHPDLWLGTVWSLSLAALIAALTGAVVGIWRIRVTAGRAASPYIGWQAWHHWLGLCSMIFVLSWIFSGWLSMDHGQLFSSSKPSPAEFAKVAGMNKWPESSSAAASLSRGVREIEWFPFGGRIYRRERAAFDIQTLALNSDVTPREQAFVQAADVLAMSRDLDAGCQPPIIVMPTDDYGAESTLPGAPVYRLVCGDTWFHIDGASGTLVERLDSSRRAYRWVYQALHTLDFPILNAHPLVRTLLITVLCLVGMLFSITAIAIGWRRLKESV